MNLSGLKGLKGECCRYERISGRRDGRHKGVVALFADNGPLRAGCGNGINQIVHVEGRDGSDADVACRSEVVPPGGVAVDQFRVVCARDFPGVVRPLVLGEDDACGQCGATAENEAALEVGPFVELPPAWNDHRTPETPCTVAGRELHVVEQGCLSRFGPGEETRYVVVSRPVSLPVLRNMVDVEFHRIAPCLRRGMAVVCEPFGQLPVVPDLRQLLLEPVV